MSELVIFSPRLARAHLKDEKKKVRISGAVLLRNTREAEQSKGLAVWRSYL